MSETANTGFWAWSLDHYSAPGVEAVLLELQDSFNLNVNMLLWCCWCAEYFEDVPEAVFRKADERLRHWSQAVTTPLRQARRFLKTPPETVDAGASKELRDDIKRIELASEKIEQSLLEAAAEENLDRAEAIDVETTTTRARHNVTQYLILAGATKNQSFSVSLPEALVARIFAGESAPGKNGEE